MRRKIFISILTILIAIVFFTAISVGQRTVEYKYSSEVAPRQVEDYTSSYELLRTQKGTLATFKIMRWIVVIGAVSIIGGIWYSTINKALSEKKE